MAAEEVVAEGVVRRWRGGSTPPAAGCGGVERRRWSLVALARLWTVHGRREGGAAGQGAKEQGKGISCDGTWARNSRFLLWAGLLSGPYRCIGAYRECISFFFKRKEFRYFPIRIGAVSGPYPYPIRIGIPVRHLSDVSEYQSLELYNGVSAYY